ncbi:hypothetical protein GGD38_007489 [Chitinophagaceae bacterium OAS944]|nr:hypothetical protein [Chitinophagaceae bacterium OAS944]
MINGLSSGNWGQAGICQLKDLWGGAVSKVEALYYANVTFVGAKKLYQ